MPRPRSLILQALLSLEEQEGSKEKSQGVYNKANNKRGSAEEEAEEVDAEAEAEAEAEENEPAFGPLGDLAHFFTRFGVYFSGNDDSMETLKQPISVQQMKDVLQHYIHLQNRTRLQFAIQKQRKQPNTNSVNDGNNDYHQDSNENYERTLALQLAIINEAIDHFPKQNKQLYRMWKRFLIWNTQDLVDCVFFCPIKQCAPLLNFPSKSQKHNSNLKEPSKWKPSTCWKLPCDNEQSLLIRSNQTLISQPNNWTWSEWLRWSRLAMRLSISSNGHNKESLHTSPLSNCSVVKIPKLNLDTPLTQTDIVALWIRAQRNTDGYLSLIRMFELEPISVATPASKAFKIRGRQEGQGGGKQLVVASDDKDDDNGNDQHDDGKHQEASELGERIKYVAKFVGMPPAASHGEEAPWLDKLIEWAVINQFLFTVPYLKKAIEDEQMFLKPCPLNFRKTHRQNDDDEKAPKRARHLVDASSHNEELSVTTRNLNEDSRTNIDSETIATNSNVPSVQAILEAKQEISMHMHLSKRLSFVLRWFVLRNRKVCNFLCNGHKVDAPLYDKLNQRLNEANIRSQIKKKAHEQNVIRTFARLDRRVEEMEGEAMKEHILRLLDILHSCTDLLQTKDIEDAKSDADRLFKAYISESRPLVADSAKGKDPLPTLTSIPAAWGTCGVCKERVGGSNTGEECKKFFKCDCCGYLFHRRCMTGKTDPLTLVELVKKYPPLCQTYCARVPSSFLELDFRGKYMGWKQSVVTIPTRHDGTCNVAGLELGLISNCRKFYESLLEGSILVEDLYSETRVKEMPFRVEDKLSGVVVLHVHNNLGADVRRGDIITHIKTGTMETRESLGSMTWKNVKQIMQSATNGDTIFWIHRADKGLGEKCDPVMRRIRRKLNKHIRVPFTNSQRLKICGNCNGNARVALSSLEEARLAQGMIRRLGIENFGRPFMQGESQNSVVSLQRLDRMMEVLSKGVNVIDAHNKGDQVDPSFYGLTPSCGPERRLLRWVETSDINKPLHLLCAGMKELISSPLLNECVDEDPYIEERSALASHFLTMFTSWHRNSIAGCDSFGTKGLPKGIIDLFEPWLNQQCKVCFAQPCQDRSPLPICGREYCKKTSQTFLGKKPLSPPSNKSNSSRCQSFDENNSSQQQYHVEVSQKNAFDKHLFFSSKVGSIIFVRPCDTLHLRVSNCFRKTIDTKGRPMQFVVASYLPSQLSNIKRKNFAESDNAALGEYYGFFHLIPLVNKDQLAVLQAKLVFRSISVEMTTSTKEWKDVDALDIDGVICVSAPYLISKLSQSNAMEDAIDSTVERLATSVSKDDFERSKDGCSPSMRSYHGLDLSLDHTHEGYQHLDENSVETGIRDLAQVSHDLLYNLLGWDGSRMHDLVNNVVQKNDFPCFAADMKLYDGDAHTDEDQCEEAANPAENPREDLDNIVNTDKMNLETLNSKNRMTHLSTEEEGKTASCESQSSSPLLLTAAPELNLNGEGSTNALILPRSRNNDLTSITITHRMQGEINIQGNPITNLQQEDTHTNTPLLDEPSHYLKVDDLFKCLGFDNVFLTRVEFAVTSALLDRSLPVLAGRLLCPRYKGKQAHQQISLVFSLKARDTRNLPQVSEAFTTEVIQVDYMRSKNETGPIVVREADGRFGYKKPVEALSLDTLYQNYLQKRQNSEGTAHLPTSPGTTSIGRDGEPQHFGPNSSHHHPHSTRNLGQSSGSVWGSQGRSTSGRESSTSTRQSTGEMKGGTQKSMMKGFECDPQSLEEGGATIMGTPRVAKKRNLQCCLNSADLRAAEQCKDSGSRREKASHYFCHDPLRQGHDEDQTDEQVGVESPRPSHKIHISHSIRVVEGKALTSGVTAERVQTDATTYVYSPVIQSKLAKQNDAIGVPNQKSDNRKIGKASASEKTNQLHGKAGVMNFGSSCKKGHRGYTNVSTLGFGTIDEITRIRGGGNPTRYLKDLPKSDFGMRLVSGEVGLEDEGKEVSSATPYIGFVEDDQNKWEVDGDDIWVKVLIIILMCEGKPQSLEEPVEVSEDVSQLALVLSGSEEAQNFAAWKRDDKVCNKPIGIKEPFECDLLTDADLKNKGSAERGGFLSDTNDGNNDGVSLLKRMLHRGIACLGSLPSGGMVIWIQVDPDALYVRFGKDPRASLEESVALMVNKRGDAKSKPDTDTYPCVWGCQDKTVSNKLLGFSNCNSLLEHLELCHSHYGTSNSMKRIHGDKIVALSRDIMSALLAQNKSLKACTKTNSRKGGKLSLDEGKIRQMFVQKNSLIYQRGRIYSRHLLRLWYRIARLFNVHQDGTRKSRLPRCPIQFSEYIQKREYRKTKYSESCFDDIIGKAPMTACELCLNGMGVTNISLGCSTILCTDTTKHWRDTMAAPSILLGHIKQFIIRFASAIPHGLRKNFDVGYSPGSGLFGLTSLWDDEKYRFFCSMVLESDNIGTIAQSVVILIGSIDSTKLPSWWNDSKAGWLSYAKIMSSPSPSRLLLYLHVFDVAMSEVSCSSSLTAQSSPRENVSAGIMKKLVQTAERSGLKPNKHKREGICMHCQTGGTGILLCGFCDKAAHGKCCYPVIKNIASIETWVCPSCSVDIQHFQP